jgi:Rhodanese-like domain
MGALGSSAPPRAVARRRARLRSATGVWLLSNQAIDDRGSRAVALKLKKTVKQMLAEANAEIETVSAEDALKLKDDPGVLFVDIRDVRELDRDGRIPGALHAPRGMLEFWVDPDSPYYREVFGSGKKFLFF